MYDYGVIDIMFFSLKLAVLASIRYWLYRDRLRIPFMPMVLILAVISLASGGLWLLTGGIMGMTYDNFRIIVAMFMLLLSCVMIKAPVAEHIFSYAFILAGDTALETTAFYIQSNILHGSISYGYPLIEGIIILIIIVPATKCLRSMINRLSKLGADRIWGWLALACFSFLFMNMIVTLPRPANMSISYPLGRYLILLGMVGIYKAAERIMDTMRSAAEAKADLALTKRRITMQQSYYDRMVTQMDEVRRMRHDIRHHRSVLSALIKNGDTAALSEYLDTVSTLEDSQIVTGNFAADSILSYFLDVAKALDVKTELNLAIGRETPVSDSDLCIMLGNLIENAVDAQKYLQPEQRYIRITAKSDTQTFTLAIDNRFDGTLLKEGEDIVSRKESGGHGIGIHSVRSVCEKYGGVLQLDTDGDMFMAGIVIGI